MIEFQKKDLTAKVKTIEVLSKEVAYDLKGYVDRLSKKGFDSIAAVGDETMASLYKYLLSKRATKNSDVPF